MSKSRTLPPTPQQIADALQCWLQCRAKGDNLYGVISSGYTYARLRKWAAERGIEVPPMTRGRKPNDTAHTQKGRERGPDDTQD